MHIGHSEVIFVGQQKYTLTEILGTGANGVVWQATGNNSEKVALKFYEPWEIKLKCAKYPNDRLEPLFCAVQKQKNCQAFKSRRHLTLRFFGVSGMPLEALAEKYGVFQKAVQDKDNSAYRMYRIACCVDPISVANGVLMMPLLGKALAGACPIESRAERQAISHTIRTACLSAFTQNRGLPDLKPGNICRDGQSFLLIDVDDLPSISASNVSSWATFTVPGLEQNMVATTLANAVLTLAQVYGTISEWAAAHFYHFQSKQPRSLDSLRKIAPGEWKYVVDVIAPDMTKAMALDTLAYKNTLLV